MADKLRTRTGINREFVTNETNASVGGRGDIGKSWPNDTVKSAPFVL
jgi:hypothetical protein